MTLGRTRQSEIRNPKSKMNAGIPFTKMVAAGNDFVLVDTVHHRLPGLQRRWASVARAICDRHAGIGADGLLVLEPSRVADARMRIFNPDGSEAEMCGNGARCAARLVRDWSNGHTNAGHAIKRAQGVRLATAAGIIGAAFAGERVRMRMPEPTGLRKQLTITVRGRTLRAGFINTGVPHLVVPVRGLHTVDVEGLGRALRTHRMFRPRGTNVDFVESAGPRAARVRIRTYERGVEAETLACGTGVTAAGALHALGQSGPAGAGRRVSVQTRSGDVLTVSCRIDGRGDAARVRNVVLEGPVQRICEGAAVWPRGGRR